MDQDYLICDMPANSGNPQYSFFEPPFSEDKLHSPELVEEIMDLPLPYGRLELKHWYFDGIRILHYKHYYNDRFLLEKNNDLDVVSLEFNLRGNYIIHHFGQVYRPKSRQHNIIYSPGTNNTFENAELQGETFKIQFAPKVFLKMIEDSNDTLKRFADKMFEGAPVVISQNSVSISPDLERAINDIINCRFTGGLKKLFLLSKSIEILVMQAEAYHRATQAQEVYCKRKEDQDRIIFAREYMQENVDSPPTLSELSKIVGVNEYKLKRGFKEVFNTTIFAYLSDYRLDIAKRSLQDNDKGISEIAYELGYSSPQHFSSAFKKKFRVTPKEVRGGE